MENASKALIIAGAILLSILIIGLGMFIYQQAAGAIGNTGIDAQKVAAYNNPFTQYEGIQKGTTVRQLCNNIVAHNTSATDSSEFITVIMGEADAGDAADENAAAADVNANINTNVKNKIQVGRTYKVSYATDPKTGYIVVIGIVLNNQ